MARAALDPALRRLAVHLGIQTAYVDVGGARRTARPEALEAVVVALVRRPVSDPGKLLAELKGDEEARLLPPVQAAWLPGPASVPVRVAAGADLDCDLVAEDGTVKRWRAKSELAPGHPASSRAMVPLPDISPGYYTLRVRAGKRRAACAVIAAPLRAYRTPGRTRDWGAFLPLYALQSGRSWGAGDFSDLRALMAWTGALGGSNVATLPLLAAFLGPSLFEASPYSPVSRLMWNEVYVDIEGLPGFERSDSARRLAASPGFRKEVGDLQAARLVDLGRVAALKRSVMQEACKTLSSRLQRELARFLRDRPEFRQYARFRAMTERHGPWQTWPAPDKLDCDPDAEAYHSYAQWAAETQLAGFAGDGKTPGLYLDLPLGVNGAGYDTWRWPHYFVQGVSVGAPPDAFFEGGQNWGFPPLHPLTIREGAYDYVIAFLRHNLRYAARLRVDHVMGLHHLFLIPDGFDARDGLYVRYNTDELHAILSLESHRSHTEIIGENLGTVPGYVNRAMARHGLFGMYVLPFKVSPAERQPVISPRASEVAGLNTHDLPPFSAWWAGNDIVEREQRGVTSPQTAAAQTARRLSDTEAVVDFLAQARLLEDRDAGFAAIRLAVERFLGASRARLLMINLEDLWGETEPQNRPGTSAQWPNWRRKARYTFEEITSRPEIAAELRAIDAARRGRERAGSPRVLEHILPRDAAKD